MADPQESIGRGSNGPLVSEIQKRLEAAGYKPGLIDGAFGPVTETAVREFQADMKREPTGVADPETIELLRKYEGRRPAAQPPAKEQSSRDPDAAVQVQETTS